MKTKHELSEAIKTKACELGFVKVGIARAEALTEESQRLREWLSRRFHSTMSWMEQNVEKRTDPRIVLPGAKSVVSLAMNYFVAAQRTDDPCVGKISRYAWGDDYHRLLTARTQALLDYVMSLKPDVNAKVYVDTGPMMDKAWAVRAGVGWIGKHTNVVTKSFGSWVFLGEILLDCELEYDEPIENLCGTCRACVDACPTAAIVDEYVLDSNRCISYLTIEHRGEIPSSLRPKLENWIFGCDVCQEVCPWSKFQRQTNEAAFFPRPENIAPQLNEIEQMTPVEFAHRFRGSAIKRTKREGLVRNARAALELQRC